MITPYLSHSEDEETSPEMDEASLALEPEKPKAFAVLMHNDDYTSMEFVVEVLEKYFQKNKEQAVQIMLQIHNTGKGVAGIYPFEIAETKASQVMDLARNKGFPLLCTVEELDE
jgi:ATP-dependent Clp protease adaptor protein ClpS